MSTPNPGFLIIINCKGDVVDHFNANQNLEEARDLVRYLDTNFPNGGPHSLWRCNGSFEKVLK